MGSTPPFFMPTDQLAGLLHDGQVSRRSPYQTRGQSPAGAAPPPACPSPACPWASRIPRPAPRERRERAAPTTCFFGSASSSQTSLVESFSCSAPVGQAAMHCPQLMQAMSRQRHIHTASSMAVLKPRFVGADHADALHILPQAATQRRHRMHLLLSRTMDGDRSSTSYSFMAPAKRSSSSTPSIMAQLLQLAVAGCARRTGIACRDWTAAARGSTFRASRMAGVLVFTTIPCVTGSTHAACSDRAPATSTSAHDGRRRSAFTSFR